MTHEPTSNLSYSPPLVISAIHTHFYVAGTVIRITKSAYIDHGHIIEVKVDHGVFKNSTINIEETHRNLPYKRHDFVCGYVTLTHTFSSRGGWNRFKIGTIRQQHPELTEPVMTGLIRFANKPNVKFPDLDPMTGRAMGNIQIK